MHNTNTPSVNNAYLRSNANILSNTSLRPTIHKLAGTPYTPLTDNTMIKNLFAGFFILVLLLSVGIAVTDEAPLPTTSPVSIARFAWAAFAVFILVTFIFFKSDIKPPRDSALGPPHFVPPAEQDIAAAQLAVGNYDRDTTELFFAMLGDLPRYLVRIREEVQILGDAAQVRVFRHKLYYLGADAPQVLLIPLARIEKGTLLDDFAVTDAQGHIVPTLPHNRIRGLLALALEGLVQTAIHESKLGTRLAHHPQQSSEAVIGELIKIVCGKRQSRRQMALPTNETTAKIDRLLDDLPVTFKWRSRIEKFCHQYVNYYVIVAEASPGDTALKDGYLTLIYSHRVPFDAGANKHQKWRRFFGLMPSTIDIPLNAFAFQVDAYHQEVIAEPGQYVFDHHLEQLDSGDPVRQDDLETEDFRPYVRLYYDADARPNAHLYIRRQLGAPPSTTNLIRPYPSRLKSVVEFREIPPGTLGAATMIALASAVIISFFAVTHTGLDANPNVPPDRIAAEQIKATLNSDIPAVLLALPAFVGVLIGSWLDLSRLRKASLTTYLALTMTMFLSLGSALYFILDTNHQLPTALTLTVHGLDAKITTDWIWLGLMAISITHFLFLFRTVIDLSRYYSKCLQKRIDKEFQFG